LHEIVIHYCVIWNYKPRAAGLAAEIERRFAIAPRLEKGSGGTFEVRLDGELLFSKHEVHRFPTPGEVEDEIARRLAVW